MYRGYNRVESGSAVKLLALAPFCVPICGLMRTRACVDDVCVGKYGTWPRVFRLSFPEICVCVARKFITQIRLMYLSAEVGALFSHFGARYCVNVTVEVAAARSVQCTRQPLRTPSNSADLIPV